MRLRLPAIALLAAALTAPLAGQSTPLRVIQASPNGALTAAADANEVRIVFSYPMIPLGQNPPGRPAWFSMTPALDGTFRWSGSSILIFTPDPAKTLPLATTFTVTVDRSAASLAGRALAANYQFRFTTPTVQLMGVRWARQNGRFDAPVVLALEFNQPVRGADVLAHTTVRHAPHDFDITSLSDEARARIAATDAAGLARYDAKVAAARQTYASRAAVPVRLATTWDTTRFPEAPERVMLETTTPPAPGAWLQVTLDARVPSPAGPAVPGSAQQSVAELDPPFFVRGTTCTSACQPSGFNAVTFTGPVRTDAFTRAVSVRDVTSTTETVVSRTGTPSPGGAAEEAYDLGLESAGYGRQPGITKWAVRIDPAMTATDGQTLGYPWVGFIETARDMAFTSFGDGHGVWETGNGATLPFSARNLRVVRQWLAPVRPAELMPRLRELVAKDFEGRPGGSGQTRTLNVTPDAIQSYGFDLSPALMAGRGLAWAAVAPVEAIPGAPLTVSVPADLGTPNPPRESSTIVQVTNIGLTVKDSAASTLIFATRLDNGQAEPGVNVSLVDLDNKTLWQGRTNNDGVALAPALELRRKPTNLPDDLNDRLEYSDFRFIVIGEKNGDVAYVASDWTEGIVPWEFGLNFTPRAQGTVLRGAVFTDRGVYRPGEAVRFKTILRTESADGVTLLPPGTAAHVEVRDNRYRLVDSRDVTMNRWSGADWQWTVPADGSVGNYSIAVTLPNPKAGEGEVEGEDDGEWLRRVDTSFLVAAYRRPDFRVDTTLEAAPPIAGQPLSATIAARYLFGNPMSARPARWFVERSPVDGAPDAVRDAMAWQGFTFGYYPDQREIERPANGDAALDAEGRLTVSVPTARGVDFASAYTLTGEVEDVTRQRIAGSSRVIVYPAPFVIGLKLPGYFAKTSTGATVDVAAVDLAGRPRADVSVSLSLKRVQWNSVRRAEGGGFYEWETERLEFPSGQWTVRTGASPVTQVLPLAEGGFYELTATATDAEGHVTRTDTSFYGTGEGYTAWERFDHNRIELKQEKTTWSPGETAKVMILSPWESATALMTIEREGIRSYKKFALTSTQQTVDIPVTEADIPNLFVSVLLVRGRTSTDIGTDGSDPGRPQFRLGYAELQVANASKQLTVTLKADREEYRPANKAKVSVKAVDAAGKPARAEVTLWAVDYGVLSLTGYAPPDLKQAVYVSRPLQVSTADSRERLVSRRVLTPKGAGEGGGGGADGNGAMRRDFRPLAFWVGSLETNGSGTATAEITLPDSLTAYHVMAVAGDAASRFGSATSEIRVSKPLTLLPAMPRFLSVGDRASIGGAVTNTTAAGGAATITIKSLDPSVLDVGGTQTITLGASATAAVRFDAVAKSAGTARLQMTARLGRENDAFETTLPVTIAAPMETMAVSGETTSRATEAIALPAGAVAGPGGLTVDVASSALVGLGEGARYVVDYPFPCGEQKASRALVLLLASELGQAFSLPGRAPASYKDSAASLLRALQNQQCENGAYALWPGACSSASAYLTAYVLDVMQVADALGVPQDDDARERALNYLEAELRQAPPQQAQYVPVWAASMAFGVKVLAEGGRNQDANITRLYAAADRMPVFALSYLADALAAANDRGPRYQDVIRRLTNAMRVERDTAHVESLDPAQLSWIWDSNTTSTAVVLEGFARRGDAAPQAGSTSLATSMARWLLGTRENGRWENTHDNARALEALVSYTRAFEAEAPDLTIAAELGGRTIGSARFAGRTTNASTFNASLRDVAAAAAADAASGLTITATGTGTAYYTARLAFQPPPASGAADRGIRVERAIETFVENGDGVASTSFAAGDLARVTLTITVPAERRFVAVTDPLPAGFEAVDGFFRTTAADLARATDIDPAAAASGDAWSAWWLRDGFDRVEKFDDRVELFATKLGTGRYQFTYLVRATTAGTFLAAGTRAEQMYAPDVNGRAAAATVIIK